MQYTVVVQAQDETGIDPNSVQVSVDGGTTWFTLFPISIVPVPVLPELIGREDIGTYVIGTSA